MANSGKAAISEREVVITRELNVSREIAFRMWTEQDHLRRWWGPHQFTNPICEIDARVGGTWRIVMRGPDGSEHECGGEYREVLPPEKLMFTNNVIDLQGRIILEGLTTVTFEDRGGGTRLIVRATATAHAPIAVQMLEGMDIGWSQSIERFAEASELERPI